MDAGIHLISRSPARLDLAAFCFNGGHGNFYLRSVWAFIDALLRQSARLAMRQARAAVTPVGPMGWQEPVDVCARCGKVRLDLDLFVGWTHKQTEKTRTALPEMFRAPGEPIWHNRPILLCGLRRDQVVIVQKSICSEWPALQRRARGVLRTGPEW